MAVVVYDFGEAEYVIVVKDCGGDEGEVDGVERVAVIHESLVSQRWDRQSFLHIAWHDPCKKELVENEAGIHVPRVQVRAGVLREGRWVRRLCFTPCGPRRRTDIVAGHMSPPLLMVPVPGELAPSPPATRD